ncbi:MAG: helix-turn-helix domain-containing protein [Heliobacteriaceae bacterium]|jgi:transcriptional regulator with XRE-family HTH domain|nr:helix-turn-helix domain-containing protein [Heliobacteriaceae bacterium]
MDDGLVYKKMFGKKIRLERVKRDWSQEKLAEISNLNINSISTIEIGKSAPNLITIIKLAQAFKIDLPKILDFNFD